jgi:hypothetical protein
VWVFSVVMSSWRRRWAGSAASPFQSEFSTAGPAAGGEEAPAVPILLEKSPIHPEQP